jgi:ribosomal protein L37AE/L43A
MKIYEGPNCQKTDCQNKAIASYSGLWLCGRCYEKLAKGLSEIQRKKTLEIIENA